MKTSRLTYAGLALLIGVSSIFVARSMIGRWTAVSTVPAASRTGPAPEVSQAELQDAMSRVRSGPGDPRRIEVLDRALRELGKKYAWGGNGPDSWDCSGLVQHCFAGAGIRLPRVTYDQVNEGEEVSGGRYEAADLLFFNRHGHVGIYICRGLMIHALGDRVKVERVSGYARSISAVRRVIPEPVGTKAFEKIHDASYRQYHLLSAMSKNTQCLEHSIKSSPITVYRIRGRAARRTTVKP